MKRQTVIHGESRVQLVLNDTKHLESPWVCSLPSTRMTLRQIPRAVISNIQQTDITIAMDEVAPSELSNDGRIMGSRNAREEHMRTRG